MNPICTCHLNGSLEFGKKCVIRHEQLPSKLDVEAASTTRKKVQKTPAINRTTKSHRPIRMSTVIRKYQKLHKDLKLLKDKNAKLKEQTVSLKTSTSTLEKQLKEEKDKNAKLTEKLSAELFDYDYQCAVCQEVFIKPVVLNCSHMFCEWCVDKYSKVNNHCPICRDYITSVVHCLNMNNLIQKRMELMPDKVGLERKNLEKSRVKKSNLVVVRCFKVSDILNERRRNNREQLPEL